MDFYKRVAPVCQHIPEGRAAIYGQIALLCGELRDARQVGYTFSQGLAGERAPARRVTSAKGVLSGTVTFGSHDMQELLLGQEDVAAAMMPDGWRVRLKRFGWDHTLEDALWF